MWLTYAMSTQRKKITIVLFSVVALVLVGIAFLYLTPSSAERSVMSTESSAAQMSRVETESKSTSSQATQKPLTGESITTHSTDTAGGTMTTARESRNDVRYVRVINSCDQSFTGECVQGFLEPSRQASSTPLRNDVVLRTDAKTFNNGTEWFAVQFDDQWLRYPDRIDELYVKAVDVEVLYEPGIRTSWEDEASTTDKRIVIDVSRQTLEAYDGDSLYLETAVSTGLELSPTTIGTFSVFKKTPSRYMQGPIEGVTGSDYYDLVGVPWNLYFTEAGEVIHGAYWHDSFGEQYSHGCVNLPPATAERLYHWADLNTTVTVRM